MKTLETTQTPEVPDSLKLHEPCEPVEGETGGEYELINNPDFEDVFRDLSDSLVGQEVAQIPFDLENYPATKLGEIKKKVDSAEAIKTRLGCAGCVLSDVCIVKSALDQITTTGKTLKEREEKLVAVSKEVAFTKGFSPVFKAAYEEETVKLLNDDTRTESIPDLLWGVEVTSSTSVKAKKISQLEKIAAIDKEADCKSYEVSISSRNYTIIDSSEALDVNGVNLPSPDESKVLLDKLFGRIKQIDKDGNPQLATADGDAQKKIKSATNEHTYEIRMAGKSRLYVIFENNEPEGEAKKIVILGAHGDSEEQQDAFIDAI